MRDIEINLLLNKAEELKALFVLGQRVIPFLEEIFLFIREISPLLDEINFSIEENLSKMPTASKQLSKVTEATEVATTEILNTLDQLSFKADTISDNFRVLDQRSTKNREILQEVVEILTSLSQGQQPTIQPMSGAAEDSIYRRITDIIRAFDESNGAEQQEKFVGAGPILEVIARLKSVIAAEEDTSPKTNSEELLESIKMDSIQMMMALQVQDITSQQLAAVNHLLQTVQKRLSEILVHFRNTEFSELMEDEVASKSTAKTSQMHRTIAFDEEAVQAIEFKETRQGNVDELLSAFQRGDIAAEDLQRASEKPSAPPPKAAPKPQQAPPKPPQPAPQNSGPASQDDIDALFGGGGGSAGANLPSSGPASQDDIDALFGGGGGSSSAGANLPSSGPASQDDIDALFGGGAASSPKPANKPEKDKVDMSAVQNLGNGPVSQDDIDALFK